MDEKKQPTTIYRLDYTPPGFFIDQIMLTVRLDARKTRVIARSSLRRNTDTPSQSLRLDGENLRLLDIAIDGRKIAQEEYRLTDDFLELDDVPDTFSLEIVTEINPDENAALSGLYRSNGNFCSQCEAEGFRRITYFIDRPDILTRFTTRVEGRKDQCPVLLANGNRTDQGEMEDGWHFAVWTDPFPKPCYLFALVAGNLVHIEDWFTTGSGRRVCLRIYVEERNKEKCGHAMRSLKKAMQWDEDVYGLEYDLDLFMIVAVDDFNMGAMENKGLNVFNSKYVLETPDTATDQDYIGIEGVVAHEYFHNWTGNRVTCRDWFQLSLKEGLTVFRDQEFSADMNSRAFQRIDDVNLLRGFQFREDAGPMAHPVRPDSYVEINNFYTATVYNKGAEVIRMIHSLLGARRFRSGMDLYFQRHDGQAVTCDDFVSAMQDASGVDLEQFKLWYSQSGTPELEVADSWDRAGALYSLTIRQSCPDTPGQKGKKPFHIPIALGLLDAQGHDILNEQGGEGDAERIKGRVVELRQSEQTFTFHNVQQRPVLSFLRDFSAPVKVKPFQNREELAFLMAHDSDLFNRWDAADHLSAMIILEIVEKLRNKEPLALDDLFVQAFRTNLLDETGDKSLIAQALSLPSETYLAQQMDVIDPDLLHQARLFVRRELALRLGRDFARVYARNCGSGSYSISPEAMGRRSLKNICLSSLLVSDPVDEEALALCLKQYHSAGNMTDVIAALTALSGYSGPERDVVLDDFYRKWKKDPLVMDKWLILQATSSLSDTLDRVKGLLNHPAFSIKNPNKIRSLIGAFCSGNHARFHEKTGEGYVFLADQLIIIDRFNAQIAARMVSPLINWRRYDSHRQQLMREQLERLAVLENLSDDLYEIVKKSM
ncbi:MAG: aminopeptidase N [Desulfocapsaceae bacterium]|nr:aminopeptidase N [Desulfocapsaceae bacterium]